MEKSAGCQRKTVTDKIIIVTPPDDIQVEGLRLLLVNLTSEQTQIITTVFNRLKVIPTIITYIWKNYDDIEWLFDKKHKSLLIMFNADDNNDLIVGFLAAQKNSYYFGTLKSLKSINNNVIYDADQLFEIMEKFINKYGEI